MERISYRKIRTRLVVDGVATNPAMETRDSSGLAIGILGAESSEEAPMDKEVVVMAVTRVLGGKGAEN